MTWRERPYAAGQPAGGLGTLFRPWTPVVKWLILANAAAALLTIIAGYSSWRPGIWPGLGESNPVRLFGALDFHYTVTRGQVWRLLTAQYLHRGAMHFFFNMLGLYFFGPPLERQFGRWTFFWFYTFCGLAGNVFFLLMHAVGLALYGPFNASAVGASGAVLGLLAGCAVLFPRMVILLLFFPVPIRVATVIFVVFYSVSVAWDFSLESAAHLGGMVGAAGWILLGRRSEGRLRVAGSRPSWWARLTRGAGRWERRQKKLRRQEERVERILAKVHAHGISSLTWWEKRTLRKASERLRRKKDDSRTDIPRRL